MIRIRKHHLPVVITFAMGMATCSSVAFASTFFGIPDGDTAALLALVQNGVATLKTMNDELDTVKGTYQEAKKAAQLGQDAYNLGAGIVSLDPNQVLHSLETAFPDVQYFEMEERYPNSWTHGTGALQAMISICVQGAAHTTTGATSVPQCSQLEHALDMNQAKLLLATNYGLARQREMEASDQESSRTLAATQAAIQLNRVRVAEARALQQACSGGNPTACQAVANQAMAMQLEQAADTNDQLALANRLSAIQIAQRNGQLRRDDTDASWREEQLRKGVQTLSAPPILLKADGFSISGDTGVGP
jgi:hypothetical protein